MSFDHYQWNIVPRSTKIKEDMLLSYPLLDKMENSLTEYEKADEATKSDTSKFSVIVNLPINLRRLIKVYNENITHINQECKSFKRGFIKPTFEEYRKDKTHRSEEAVRHEYEDECASKRHSYMTQMSEVHNLGQLGLFSKDLKQKIQGVIHRSLAQNLPVQTLPTLIDCMKLEASQILVFESRLRAPLDEAVLKENAPASTDAPTPSTSSTSSSSTVQPSENVAVTLLPQAPESTQYVSAKIVLPLKEGTLGICHDPSWGEAPVPFTSTNEGWKGPIPLNREFKCVIVKDGKVIEWEVDSGNRSIKPDSSLPFRMGAPKFSSLPGDQAASFVIDRTAFGNAPAEVPVPQPIQAPNIVSITVQYPPLAHAILGICHAPNWEPVSFIQTSEGWQGQVPYDTDFKYVIIEEGKVVKWELGANRNTNPNSSVPHDRTSPNFS